MKYISNIFLKTWCRLTGDTGQSEQNDLTKNNANRSIRLRFRTCTRICRVHRCSHVSEFV